MVKSKLVKSKRKIKGSGISKSLKVFQLKSVIEQYLEKYTDKKIRGWKTAKKDKLIQIFDDNNININEFKIPQKNPKPAQKYTKDLRKKYNKKTYDQSEQASYLLNLSNNERYKNPLQALDLYTNKEGKKEYVKLEPHQDKLVKQFIYSNLRGCIAYLGVGSGKTLTAVVSSYLYLKMYPNNKVIVISPSSLLFNFTNGMVQYGLDVSDNRYHFYTYDKYIRNPLIGKNALVIIDEAHNLRTQISEKNIMNDQGEIIDTVANTNQRGFKIMKYATNYCHKVLLLTGTAFLNSLFDIENLLAMVDNRKPIAPIAFADMLANPDNISDYFNFRISYFKTSPESIYFPKKIEKLIGLYMSEEEEQEYNELEQEGPPYSTSDKPNSFLSAEKYASNTVGGKDNPKIKWIIDEIMKNSNEKFIVYSGLYDAGIKLISQVLNDKNICYKSITGRESTTQKEDAKRYFNGYNFNNPDFFDISTVEENQRKYINDKYRVLLISRAGAEGVDTINSNNIILLDSQWNDALSEQIIARAIRFKSHFGLPENKRYVNVYKTLLLRKANKEIFDKISHPNFDDWTQFRRELNEAVLLRMNLSKMDNESFLPSIQMLKDLKKPVYSNGKITGEEKFIPEKTQYDKKGKVDGQEGWDIYDNFRKVPDLEKREEDKRNWKIKMYAKWYVSYGKTEIEKQQKALPPFSRLSADIKMLIVSKSKQKNIDDFCELFGTNIQLFEQYQSKLLPYIIEEEKKLKRQLTDEEQVNIYAKLLNSDNSEILNTKYVQPENLKEKKRTKPQTLQQYFTNEILAQAIIDKSSIKKNNNKITVLEPSAGSGNLIVPLLKLKKDMTIDLVEIDKKNRIELEKLVSISPNTLQLKEQGNFLKYIASQRYDYIFMNPPFHLRRTENMLLKKDVYDIDFVKRAFALLKVGAELIAITSTKWRYTEEFKSWLEDESNKTFTFELKKNEKFGDATLDITVLKLVKKNESEDSDILNINYYKDYASEIGEQILNNEINVSDQKPQDILIKEAEIETPPPLKSISKKIKPIY